MSASVVVSPAIAGISIPTHVAMIMDGNGRWAKSHGLPRTAGHKKGADTLREMLHACQEHGVEYLTVYAFSSENWKRPESEVMDLMQLLKLYLSKEIKELHKSGIKIRFIGDRAQLSADIQHMLEDAEKLTEGNTSFNLNIALSYGSRKEMVRAVQKLITLETGQVTEETISEALDTAGQPDPDLLIRTGGEHRLSNFLLWQMAYTELYFTSTLWPDFTKAHFAEAIAEYSSRERRYGNAS